MKPTLLLLCLWATLLGHAQSSGNNTLLWRISRPGNAAPSYLFGTMHRKDFKLFHFKDSLYHALKTTDGFAMEVDPDATATLVVERMMNAGVAKKIRQEWEEDKTVREKKEAYENRLSQRLNIPKAQLSAERLRAEAKKLKNKKRKQQMDLAMDLWLYEAAGRLGKWQGGIEDPEDQVAILGYDNVRTEEVEELLAESGDLVARQALNLIYELYLAENLAAIDSLMHLGDEAWQTRILYRRNVKMARRMDSLQLQRSMFFAVGAAHLPGDSGVIALLRERGFVVEPVHSKNRMAANQFVLPAAKDAWVAFADSAQQFSALFPGKARKMNLMNMVDFYASSNTAKDQFFLVMVVPNYKGGGPDTMMAALMNSMDNSGLRFGGPSKLTRNGLPGAIFRSQSTTQSQALVLVDGHLMHVALAVVSNEEDSADIKRFLEAYQPIHRKQEDASVQLSDAAAISPKLVGQSRYRFLRSKEMEATMASANTGVRANAFVAVDANNGISAFLILVDLPEGAVNDTLRLRTMIGNMSAGLQLIDSVRMQPAEGGFTAFMEGVSKADQSYMAARAQLMQRTAMIYLVNGANQPAAKAKMLASLQELRLRKMPLGQDWRWHEQDSFRIYAPSDFAFQPPADAAIDVENRLNKAVANGDDEEVTVIGRIDVPAPADTAVSDKTAKVVADSVATKRVADNLLFTGRDSLSGYGFSMTISTLDPNSWCNHGAHFKKMVEAENATLVASPFRWSADSLSVQYSFTDSAHPGRVWVQRQVLRPGKRYFLSAELLVSDTGHAFVRQFFNDFQASPAPVGFQPFERKAAQAIQRFMGRLSAEEVEDLGNKFSNLPFSLEDSLAFQQALLQPLDTVNKGSYWWTKVPSTYYALDTQGLVRYALKELIGRPETDKHLIDFALSKLIKSNLPNDSIYLPLILKKLNAMDGDLSTEWETITALRNRYAQLQPHFPELLRLLKKPDWVDPVLRITQPAVEENLLSKTALLSYEKPLLAHAEKLLKEADSATVDGDPWRYLNYTNTLGQLNTATAKTTLLRLTKARETALQVAALSGLLQAKMTPPPVLLTTLCKQPSARLQVFRLLKGSKKENLFPAVYKSRQRLAEGQLWQNQIDNEENPSNIQFLTSTTRLRQGQKHSLLLFELVSAEGDAYLAASIYGPKQGAGELLAEEIYFFWDKPYNKAQQASLTDDLWASWQQQMNEAEEEETP